MPSSKRKPEPAAPPAPPATERVSLRKVQAEETRERLLAAALDVFSECGYHATTAGMIADAAGASHGTFYVYFRNKDDAFEQVIMRMFVSTVEASEPDLARDPYDRLLAQVRGFLSVFVERSGLIRAFIEGIPFNPTIAAYWRLLHEHNVKGIERHIQDAQRDGLARDADPRKTAQAIASMSEWYGFTHLVVGEDESGPSTDLDDAAATLTDVCYHAVYGKLT